MKRFRPFSIAALLSLLAALSLSLACEDPAPKTLPPAGMAGSGAAADTAKVEVKGDPNFATLEMTTLVARVNGTDVTRGDVERTMMHRAAQLGGNPSKLPKEVKDALLYSSYESAIRRVLVFQQAKKEGLEASAEDVAKQVKGLKDSIPKDKKLSDILAKMHTTEEKLTQDIQQDLSIAQLQKARAKKIKAPTEEELKARYQKDLELFRPPAQAELQEILVKVKDNSSEDSVNAALKKAQALHKEVLNASQKEFARVAKKKSDAPSKSKGGSVSFARNERVPDFGAVAFALKPNEISRVFRTEEGFWVLRGHKMTKPEPAPFDKAKPALIKRLLIEARQADDKVFIDSLTSAATIERIKEPVKPLPPQPPAPPKVAQPTLTPPAPAHGQAGAASAPASAPAGHGGMAGMGGDTAFPIPSKDNVLPGAPNPHADKALKVDGKTKGDHGLRVRAPSSQPKK